MLLSSHDYTLACFLFDFVQSTICRGIQMVQTLIRMCILIPQKIYKIAETEDTSRNRKYFSGLFTFIEINTYNNRYNQGLKTKKDISFCPHKRKDVL